MRKKYLHMPAILVSLLFVVGCEHQEKAGTDEEQVEFDSIVADTTAFLTTEARSPKSELHLNIKYAKGKKYQSLNDSLFRSGILTPDYLSLSQEKIDPSAAIRQFVQYYVADYQKDFGRLYQQDTEHGSSYELQYSCNTSVSETGNGLVNYVAHVYKYAGGAHGLNLTVAKNIDKKTGRILRLSDVFSSGYESGVSELIASEVCKMYDAKDVKDLPSKGLFVGISPYVPSNFILRADEVEFIYGDTEIAPHSFGEIRVVLSKKVLKDYLKN